MKTPNESFQENLTTIKFIEGRLEKIQGMDEIALLIRQPCSRLLGKSRMRLMPFSM
jgi:hypothetical protein